MKPNTNITIRKATIEDAKGKGYVHYTSWKETYTGLFPDEVMNSISLERSIKMAEEHPENTFVAIADNQIVGFSCYIESRDEDLPDAGEINAIYILKEYQGMGIGKKLMKKCYEQLKNHEYVILWVLKDNSKSIGFYESEGFRLDGKVKVLHDNDVVRMIRKT